MHAGQSERQASHSPVSFFDEAPPTAAKARDAPHSLDSTPKAPHSVTSRAVRHQAPRHNSMQPGAWVHSGTLHSAAKMTGCQPHPRRRISLRRASGCVLQLEPPVEGRARTCSGGVRPRPPNSQPVSEQSDLSARLQGEQTALEARQDAVSLSSTGGSEPAEGGKHAARQRERRQAEIDEASPDQQAERRRRMTASPHIKNGSSCEGPFPV